MCELIVEKSECLSIRGVSCGLLGVLSWKGTILGHAYRQFLPCSSGCCGDVRGPCWSACWLAGVVVARARNGIDFLFRYKGAVEVATELQWAEARRRGRRMR